MEASQLRTSHVAGQERPSAASEATHELPSAGAGRPPRRMAFATTDIVVEAVAAARHAQPGWAARPSHERAAFLRAAADRLLDHQEELAQGISAGMGKTITDSRAEVGRTPWTLRMSATAAETLDGEKYQAGSVPLGAGLTAFSVRQPVGVIGAITPFNAPLNLVAHKVGPALAAGNAIVVKPSATVPEPALALARILSDCGVPDGVVNVVIGDDDVGRALVEHRDVDLLTFTGSRAGGTAVQQAAGLRRTVLELGGNAPNLVHEDADLDHAIRECVRGGFKNAGQSCNSVQRVLVHKSVAEEVVSRLSDAVGSLQVGDPFDEATDIGPVVDEESATRIADWIDQAVDGGGKLLVGGWRDRAVVAPAVIDEPPSGSDLWQHEVFGPVVVVRRYADLDEAIALANDGDEPLQAAVFTRSMAVASRVCASVRAGGVLVNRSSNFRLDQVPFGGTSGAGIGKEGPWVVIKDMTQEKLVVLDPER